MGWLIFWQKRHFYIFLQRKNIKNKEDNFTTIAIVVEWIRIPSDPFHLGGSGYVSWRMKIRRIPNTGFNDGPEVFTCVI